MYSTRSGFPGDTPFAPTRTHVPNKPEAHSFKMMRRHSLCHKTFQLPASSLKSFPIPATPVPTQRSSLLGSLP